MKKQNKYIQYILEVSKITFTCLLFVLLPLVIFTLITSKTTLLNGIQSFIVLTGSMEPNVPVGSIIFTQKAPQYKTNEVIAFQQGEVTITHRVVGIEKKDNQTFYKTRGDANKATDTQLVSESNVLGKRIFKAENAGKLILFLKTLPGFMLFVILPTLIFIGFEIVNIKKELEKEIERKLISKYGINSNV